jgi:hypothetical protein
MYVVGHYKNLAAVLTFEISIAFKYTIMPIGIDHGVNTRMPVVSRAIVNYPIFCIRWHLTWFKPLTYLIPDIVEIHHILKVAVENYPTSLKGAVEYVLLCACTR